MNAPSPRVLGLGGGIGASRVWTELARRLPPSDLTLVVNVADDLWAHGLRICPDIDTVLYALSGRQDLQRGWGVRDESFRCMDVLREYGKDIWFNLGDRDLATHLFRTEQLHRGAAVSDVTDALATAMGVTVRVLPVTDDPIRTSVRLSTGQEIDYQEFLVKRGASDVVAAVHWHGLTEARPTDRLLDVIAAADLIIVGPSNPMASIHPIVEVPGIRRAIAASAARVVAVSPVVQAVVIRDEGERRRAASRTALLASLGLPHRASTVAAMYADFVDAFVVDEADAADEVAAIAACGVVPIVASTLLHLPSGAHSDLVAQLIDQAVDRTVRERTPT